MENPTNGKQPQHTNGGQHYWLQYTTSDGKYYASDNEQNIINSYGPTYADIDMTYISDDGNIKVTYNHMEMPQTDENRTYYQISYEVLGDVSISDFKRDFSFYSVRGLSGDYGLIGYLDENISVVLDGLQGTRFKAYRPEASILMWIDCREMGWDTAAYHRAMEEAGIQPDPGHYYFMDNSKIDGYSGMQSHFRLNIGAPRSTIEEAVRRIRSIG